MATEKLSEEAAQRIARASVAMLRSKERTAAVEERKAQKKGLRAAKRQLELEKQQEELRTRAAEASPKGDRLRLRDAWRLEFAKAFPMVLLSKSLSPKQWGQLDRLLGLYNVDQVESAFAYVLRNWSILRKRYTKPGGDSTPTFGLVLYFHDRIFPDADMWQPHADVCEEYDGYGDRYKERPPELMARYLEARKTLKSLGLIE
jgi:hypothetical protein